MKVYTKIFALAALLCGFLFAAPSAFAQVTANDSISVSATNDGFFTFAIADAAFDFGNVDATGKQANGLSGVDDATGATYTKSSASTTVQSCSGTGSPATKICFF